MGAATPMLARTERVIIAIIAAGALAVAAVQVVVVIARVIALSAGAVTLTGVPTAAPLPAGFADATFDAVTVTVTDPSPGIRFFAAGAAVLGALLGISVGLLVAWLCVRLIRERPFVRSATWGTAVVSLVVFVSGLGAPLLQGMAAQRAALSLGTPQLPTFLVEVDLAPVGWALALAVVAGVFELGQRLQRDSDGLV